MPTCARVTSLGIYLYVALDLPVRPGLSDPGPFYDHYHYGPPGPLMQPFPRGSDRTSRYKCRVGRTAATRHATLDAAAARRGAASMITTTIMQPPLAGMTVTSRYKCRVWYIVMKIYYHHTSAGLGCGRFDTLQSVTQRIGSCIGRDTSRR